MCASMELIGLGKRLSGKIIDFRFRLIRAAAVSDVLVFGRVQYRVQLCFPKAAREASTK